MANTNLSDTTKDNLSGMRNKFSNFSFGKMFGETSATKSSSENSNDVNRKTSASDKSPTAARNEKRTQIVNTAYYTTISEGQHKNLKRGDGLADILAKIYNLLRFQQQEEIQRGELEKNRESALESKNRRKKLTVVPKYSRVTKAKEKGDQYEDIIDLLMPAFKLLKGAFEGLKAIFSGILSTITGLFDVVGSLFSVLYKSIKLVTSGIFKVIGGLLSISKSLLGLAGTIVTIITEFMFKEIIAPLTKSIMKSIVWIANKITNNIVTNAISNLLDALASVPGIGPIIRGAASMAGIYATYQAGKELIALGTKAFIGDEAFNMIEDLEKARATTQEKTIKEKEERQKIYDLQARERGARSANGGRANAESIRLSGLIQNAQKAHENSKAVSELKEAQKVQAELQKKYNESKESYRKNLDEKLALLDLKINENDVSIIPGKNGEKLYGLIDKNGDTYSPETSAATIEMVKALTPENISAEKFKEMGIQLEKKVLESEPVQAVTKGIETIRKDLDELTDPIINGKNLEEISKKLSDIRAKAKWAIAPAEVTNITVGAPANGNNSQQSAVEIGDIRNKNESIVEASLNNTRLAWYRH